eukprot:IDg8218t1
MNICSVCQIHSNKVDERLCELSLRYVYVSVFGVKVDWPAYNIGGVTQDFDSVGRAVVVLVQERAFKVYVVILHFFLGAERKKETNKVSIGGVGGRLCWVPYMTTDLAWLYIFPSIPSHSWRVLFGGDRLSISEPHSGYELSVSGEKRAVCSAYRYKIMGSNAGFYSLNSTILLDISWPVYGLMNF